MKQINNGWMYSMLTRQFYHIRVEGILDSQWSDWLGGMAISQEPGGVTLLSGFVRDQAELFGLIIKVRDLGLNLISVNRAELPKGDCGA